MPHWITQTIIVMFVLTGILALLKIHNLILWPWLLVTAPITVPVILVFSFILLLLVHAYICEC